MPDWVWVVGFIALYIVHDTVASAQVGCSHVSEPNMRRRVSAQDCR